MSNLKELPKLMVDDSEKDGPAEAVMDYVLSWSLRRADVNCIKLEPEKPKLYNYCRLILAKFLEINLDDSVVFENVKVWKQECYIDLWVEVQVNGKNHAILIEDKYYSPLRAGQLEGYKKDFDEYYNSQSEDYSKHYVLFTCIDREDPKFAIYNEAKKLRFNIFSFYELLGKECDYEYSESEIFNEFWFRWGNINNKNEIR